MVNRLTTIALALLVGGTLGFGYHKLVGCQSGGCPLVATPLRAIIYGAVVGLIWAVVTKTRS
jgi:hypothetical protein